jgi:uncharacterized protein YcaQ
MPLTLPSLRRAVVRQSLAKATDLASALAHMGFVQADPIRSPARAQDLILRHRVQDYRAGDLERRYPELAIDEDYVYAYGFVPGTTRELLHPRGGGSPAGLARRVFEFVAETGPTHPKTLLSEFGRRRVTNAWGGQSHSTTRILEDLHFRGFLRVARREKGIRVYQSAPRIPAVITPNERLRRLTLMVARLFGPLPEPSLRSIIAMLRYSVPHLTGRSSIIGRLLQTGDLERGEADGTAYLWPAGSGPGRESDDDETVRFMAPFDPLVWDRRRFEHLWGWSYRFEAYTPPALRQFGYYAMPLLWGSRVIGWANLTRRGRETDVVLGFAERQPKQRAFKRGLDAEVARLTDFFAAPMDR